MHGVSLLSGITQALNIWLGAPAWCFSHGHGVPQVDLAISRKQIPELGLAKYFPADRSMGCTSSTSRQQRQAEQMARGMQQAQQMLQSPQMQQQLQQMQQQSSAMMMQNPQLAAMMAQMTQGQAGPVAPVTVQAQVVEPATVGVVAENGPFCSQCGKASGGGNFCMGCGAPCQQVA